MSMDRIKVIVKEPGEPVGHMTEIENTLEAMQKIVGGYIEPVPAADGSDRIILIGKGEILMDGGLEDIKKGNDSIDETVAELYRAYDV